MSTADSPQLLRKKIITINSHSHNTSNPCKSACTERRKFTLYIVDFSANSISNTTQFPFIFTILLSRSLFLYLIECYCKCSRLTEILLLHKIVHIIIVLGCFVLLLFYFPTHTKWLHCICLYLDKRRTKTDVCVCLCNKTKCIYCEFY